MHNAAVAKNSPKDCQQGSAVRGGTDSAAQSEHGLLEVLMAPAQYMNGPETLQG